ncbi:MAG: hypothetical protein ACREBW_07660, partial [Candidatus Micrarchaeaceae archaeon]
SSLFTGSRWEAIQTAAIETPPRSFAEAVGRPFVIAGNLVVYDNVYTNPYVQPVDYPLYGPGFQGGGTIWAWGNTTTPVDGRSWVNNIQACYSQIQQYAGPTAPQVANLSYDTTTIDDYDYGGFILPSAVYNAKVAFVCDWISFIANKNPTIQSGASNCVDILAEFEYALDGEAAYHFNVTQPAITAIMRAQIPALWLEPFGQGDPIYGASFWKPAMDANYNPSTSWPSEADASPVMSACDSAASCAQYAIVALTPSLGTGTWTDAAGLSNVSFVGFNGLGNFFEPSPNYVGNSYDPDRGVVIDTQQAVGLTWQLNFTGGQYSAFTLSWWQQIPTLINPYAAVNQNRPLATIMQFDGINVQPGGTVYLASAGTNGNVGTATPYLANGASIQCWFDLDSTVGLTETVRANYDQWHHWVMAVSQDYQFAYLYR